MTEEQAKKRFMQLNLTRLAGLISVMIGMTNVAGKLLPEFAPWLGALFVVNGFADFFILPVIFKKFWQKQDQ